MPFQSDTIKEIRITIPDIQIKLPYLILNITFSKNIFFIDFQDTLNPFCLVGFDFETNTHFFFTAPCLVTKNAPYRAQSVILIVL